jgi:hypothetical protein
MNRARPPLLLLSLSLAGACASSPPPGPATAAGTPPAASAAAPAAPALRTPEAILADAVQATGGAAAWNSHRTAHFKIDTIFQGMGMGGSGERFVTSAGKSLVVTELVGLGTIREGTNAKVFWSQDALQGFRFLEGAEAEEARIEASWNTDMQAKDLFTKLEAASEPGPDGAPLECVIATPRVGAPIHSCYDRTTHLQVLQTGIKATPQGDVPFRAVAKDWRDVGGVKMAFEAETQVGPITLVARIKSVTFDEPMDDKMFEPPVPAPAGK